ncbi:glycosyl hydrolase family 18 protein [Marinisporobacter balticus]|uniref:Copper amine oxidase-like protein n=1 Tax=Marinisporobacter balticus TaxID=2018667 RepID=A0A4V2SB14_9FIRM|nr:glycosyl hydrolase family 18 protein [Marinisporobacter balticus]TCO73770.1 copper amine oxidase-like protein [Marinisporobacter balticus]
MRISKKIVVLLVITFMTVGAMISILEWKKEKVDLNMDTRLIIEDQEIAGYEEPYVDDTGIYLPYNVVVDHLYQNMTLDKKSENIFINLENQDILLEDPTLTDFIKDNKIAINVPTKVKDGQAYVPVSLLNKLFEIDICYVDDTKAVIIDHFSSKIMVGEITEKKAKIKSKSFSLINPKLKKGDQVRVYGEEENDYIVRSDEGIIGTIEKKYVRVIEEERKIDKQLNEKRELFNSKNQKINIVWEYVNKKSPDLSKEIKIESLDVIVPTWFSIANDKGTVMNNGDRNYVEEAHEKGYKVWGLVNNSFDPAITASILKDEKLRKKVIGQLVIYASLYDLDGINIDFENVYYEDQKALVKFVEEIKYYTKKQNLVLSMDITVPSSSKQWSKVYDRRALGKLVDYMAVMTYDEHWASSPVSGSVASVGWVEKGILNTLKSIPEEKILLGLPFYTRRWKESKDASGKVKVESKAISMTWAKKIIDEKNAPVIWNEEVGQYYAQYNEDDAVYKIWLEDPRSIALKVDLVEKHNLAGTAAWRRGYEDVQVWAVLQKIIKNGKTYTELGFNN